MVVLANLVCIRYSIKKVCESSEKIAKNGVKSIKTTRKLGEMTSSADKPAVSKPGLDDPAREARRRRMEIRRLKVIAHAGICPEVLGKRSRSEGGIVSPATSDGIIAAFGAVGGDTSTAHLSASADGGFVADAMSPSKGFAEKKEGFRRDCEGEFVSSIVVDGDDKDGGTVVSVSSSCGLLPKSLATMAVSSVPGDDTLCDDNTSGLSSVNPQTAVASVPGSSGGLGLGGNGSGGIELGGENGGLAGLGEESGFGADDLFLPWGYASICGRRPEMEDAVAVVPRLVCVSSETVGELRNSGKISPFYFFGVYDGHGGSQAAKFCKTRLHQALTEELEVVMNGDRSSSGGVEGGSLWKGQWEKALVGCFNKVDAEIGGRVFRRKGCGEEVIQECCSDSVAPETVGSTAAVAVVGSCQIIVANCGDSRVVLSRGGKAIALSVDHKPERKDEMERIEAAGGRVIHWNGYRVFGVLAMSRAIGDRYLKPCVISDPEVTFTERRDEDECLILASDGLWDVLSNEEVCEVARRCLARGRSRNKSSSPKSRDEEMDTSAQAVADHLSMLAFQRGSSDNITVVVVDLLAKRNA